jgi:ribosomal protein S18 acetylase RimI-like enzyme
MNLRKYMDADFDQMMHLHRVVLKKENVYRGPGFWEEDLFNIKEYYFENKGEFIVGIKDNKLIAMGALRKINDQTAEIVRMRVHPELQGKGFGSKILKELEESAIKKNYVEIVLETDERLTNAINLYRKNGYYYWKEEEISGYKCIWYKKLLRL